MKREIDSIHTDRDMVHARRVNHTDFRGTVHPTPSTAVLKARGKPPRGVKKAPRKAGFPGGNPGANPEKPRRNPGESAVEIAVFRAET